jgi:hypothetical protein
MYLRHKPDLWWPITHSLYKGHTRSQGLLYLAGCCDENGTWTSRSLTLCLYNKRKTFMSLHSGRNFFSLTTLRDVARLDLGCIVLLSQHSFLFSLSELLLHSMLHFFSSFSHPALLAPCIILNNSDFLSFLCLSLAVAFHSCFLDILHPWSMSAPVLCVSNKWIRSVLASGYENPFFYVDDSLSVFS